MDGGVDGVNENTGGFAAELEVNEKPDAGFAEEFGVAKVAHGLTDKFYVEKPSDGFADDFGVNTLFTVVL